MKKVLSHLGLALLLCAVTLLSSPLSLFAAREELHSGTFVQFHGLQHNDLVATIETSEGTLRVILYERYAPLAVSNFSHLAAEGYYDGTSFHRVIQDFISQGGDPTGTGTGGESRWGTPFLTEAREGLRHFSGALCMAGAGGALNTHGSQFYIVATPQGNLDAATFDAMREAGVSEYVIDMYNAAGGLPYLDNTDTVFGQVYEGMEIVDAIAAAKTDENDRPLEDITVLSITVERYQDEEVLAAEAEAAANAEAEGDGEAGEEPPPEGEGEAEGGE